MLEIGDPIPSGRDAHVAHETADLAEWVADRILEPILAPYLADDGKLRSVRRPIGLPHALLYLPRRTAVEVHSRERAGEEPIRKVMGIKQDGELSFRRDRKQVHAARTQRLRLGIVGTHRKDLGRIAPRRGAVHHCVLAREGGLEDGLVAKVQLVEGECLGLAARA